MKAPFLGSQQLLLSRAGVCWWPSLLCLLCICRACSPGNSRFCCCIPWALLIASLVFFFLFAHSPNFCGFFVYFFLSVFFSRGFSFLFYTFTSLGHFYRFNFYLHAYILLSQVLSLHLEPSLAPKKHTFDYLLSIYLIHTFEITSTWLLLFTYYDSEAPPSGPKFCPRSAPPFVPASGSNTILMTTHSMNASLDAQSVIENCQFHCL